MVKGTRLAAGGRPRPAGCGGAVRRAVWAFRDSTFGHAIAGAYMNSPCLALITPGICPLITRLYRPACIGCAGRHPASKRAMRTHLSHPSRLVSPPTRRPADSYPPRLPSRCGCLGRRWRTRTARPPSSWREEAPGCWQFICAQRRAEAPSGQRLPSAQPPDGVPRAAADGEAGAPAVRSLAGLGWDENPSKGGPAALGSARGETRYCRATDSQHALMQAPNTPPHYS